MSWHDRAKTRRSVAPGPAAAPKRDADDLPGVSHAAGCAGSGPAKRVYAITDEGREVLDAWVAYMERQAAGLLAFVERYRNR